MNNLNFLRPINGHVDAVPPVWLMRQAGRYLPEYRKVRQKVSSFLEMCYTPEKAVEVTLQPIRRYGFDAAILFSDILVIPDALGQDVNFEPGRGPVLGALKDHDDVARLEVTRTRDHLSPVFETVKTLRGELPEDTALIGFAGAPWTVATYMIEGGSSKDYALARRWAYEATESGFELLMDKLVASTSEYLCAQIEAGADVVKLFDSWAGVLPDTLFDRWVIEPARQIVQNIRKQHPETPVIGFARGAGVRYALYREQTGIDVLALDQTVPASSMAELGKKGCVQGNLDPVTLRIGGKVLQHEVSRILSACKDVPMIFNLGHGITPDVPPENVDELLSLIRG